MEKIYLDINKYLVLPKEGYDRTCTINAHYLCQWGSLISLLSTINKNHIQILGYSFYLLKTPLRKENTRWGSLSCVQCVMRVWWLWGREGGMGEVHHAWLSCNPPIFWMRQNMDISRAWRHVIISLRHEDSYFRLVQSDIMQTHCPDSETRHQSGAALLFQWSGSLVSPRGQHSVITKHDSQEYCKDILRIERS